MNRVIFSLITIFLYQTSYCQIEIEDKSIKPTKKSIPFNGEFMTFEVGHSEEIKAGLVGEYVTLIDVQTYNIYTSEKNFESRNYVSNLLKDQFQNKTFLIIEYKYNYGDLLTIKNEDATYIWNVRITDKYIFNKYLDRLRTYYEGKSFVPLHKKSEIETLDGSKISIDGNSKYMVTKVKLGKLSGGYGIIFNLNDSISCIFPNEFYSQPTVFNGSTYVSNPSYINIESNDPLKSNITLIEESEFKVFSQKNKNFLSKIRNREVQVGMTSDQCSWAWGPPSKLLENIAGYEKVFIYGESSYMKKLYFNNDILKLIK
jgi:hypothetical protein